MIPFITWTLNENVKLHAFIAQFLTAIRNLSIHIQESVKMVKMAKGIFVCNADLKIEFSFYVFIQVLLAQFQQHNRQFLLL